MQVALYSITPFLLPSYYCVVRTHPDKAMYPVLFDEVSSTLPAGLCCRVTSQIRTQRTTVELVAYRPDSIVVIRILNDSV